jgi:hypothetical protein
MQISEDRLIIERELSELDKEVLEFIQVFRKLDIEYVIVSGYVAILTGRSRGTEDVDLIIPKLEEKDLDDLKKEFQDKGYWCINQDLDEIDSHLEEGISVRIAKEGNVIPNFELFYPEDKFDREALNGRFKVKIQDEELFISPLELQIAYKLFLGSEKDLEDALHLFQLFGNELDQKRLNDLAERLDVGEKLDELRS